MEIGYCFGRWWVMGKVESCSKIKDGNERLAQRENEMRRSILKICIIYIFKKRLQSKCVALMDFGKVTASEESQ